MSSFGRPPRRTDDAAPRSVLAHLLLTAREVTARLERDAVQTQSDEDVARWSGVRQCWQELLLLIDAIGVTAPAAKGSLRLGNAPLRDLRRAYAAALGSDLPRPVRAVLEQHLHRLHRVTHDGKRSAA